MSFVRNLFIKLPDTHQDRIIEILCKNGKIFDTPQFKMHLNSIEFFGGDLDEIKEAFTISKNKKKSLIQIFRELGDMNKQKAYEEFINGNTVESNILYRRAAVYYLMGDWYTYDQIEIEKNYKLMRPCYDKVCELSNPPIEKVDIPFNKGSLKAYYRVPSDCNPPYPAIIILPGNSEVKEFNYELENIALKTGLATLNIDPPGWGESGLSGNKFDSIVSYEKAMNLAVDYLQGKEEIRSDAVGIFGFGFGGTMAVTAAGLESRIFAVAAMGSPVLDFRKIKKCMPKAQVKRAFIYSGTKCIKELENWMNNMDFRNCISRVQAPVLIIHGEKDEIVDKANSREIIKLVKGEKELVIIPNEDHMCTSVLKDEIGPYMLEWLYKKLSNKRMYVSSNT